MSLIALGLLYPLMFVIVISVVIVIHELGHYWAGRYFGAAVESFSMGFGKSVFERTDKNNTRWRVNWLPLGGFVNFVGEGGVIENDSKPEALRTSETDKNDIQKPVGRPFNNLSVGARNIVALAGPFANFVLAIAIFAVIGMAFGDSIERTEIAAVIEGGAGAEAGLQAGDVFVEVNNKPADRLKVILSEIKMSAGTPVDIVVRRGDDLVSLTATPRRRTEKNSLGMLETSGFIEVSLNPTVIDRNRLNPVAAIRYGFSETGTTISQSIKMIGRIVTGQESLNQMSGPVGIANVAGGMAKSTLEQSQIGLGMRLFALFAQTLHLIAFISVAVGFFNLIPLPILDGGVVVFNTYEAVTGKGLSDELMLKTKFATVLLLGLLAVFITVGDFQETGLLEIFRGL